jgi:hypothetical protein
VSDTEREWDIQITLRRRYVPARGWIWSADVCRPYGCWGMAQDETDGPGALFARIRDRVDRWMATIREADEKSAS